MKSNDSDHSRYSHEPPSYLEESVVKPFYHTDLKANLEGIVFNSQHSKEKGILEKVFSDILFRNYVAMDTSADQFVYDWHFS